ncbi:hypothetical protein ACFVVM_32230 [Nocardia sp. NPDC058176]|uniref:Rv0361 family membrane protein n=1 Tax=Nocardia sp. NPDC058176 TaxID=3346368 RepID=UPI0036D7957D
MTNPPDFPENTPSGPPGYPHAGAGPGGPPPGQPGPDVFPPPQPPKKSRTGLFITLGVVALVVIGALITGVVLTMQGRTPLATDEKKIEVAIRDFYDTLDADGFIAAAELACEADRSEIENLSPEQRQQFDSASVSVVIDEVTDIVITGDTAKATVVGELTLTVEGSEPNTEDSTEEHLLKEDGTWKICSAPAMRR